VSPFWLGVILGALMSGGIGFLFGAMMRVARQSDDEAERAARMPRLRIITGRRR
jgi:hypothetical protein